MTGTSSSVYLGSLCADGHLRWMLPMDKSSSSSSLDSSSSLYSEPEPESLDESIQQCTAAKHVIFQNIVSQYPYVVSSPHARVTVSQAGWNIELCLIAEKPVFESALGVFKPTKVTRISFGKIPFSDGPFEILRFKGDECFGEDPEKFKTSEDMIKFLKRYITPLEPVE